MALLHLQVVSPPPVSEQVATMLSEQPGVVSVAVMSGAARRPVGDLVVADMARECVSDVLARLHSLGVPDSGSITLSAIDTAIGQRVEHAERDAPGEGSDAVIWDEVVSRTGEDSTLTWTFLSFMVLACVLAAIGVATDSPITIVGAMVVGPEFGPLAGIAVGLLLGRRDAVRRALVALLVGFPVAVLAAALVAVVWRATGLVDAQDLVGSRQTEFIYQPGWFSLMTALVAGAAGTLSLTSAKSAALIGVFISITTIPAAGNAAVATVFGQWSEAGGSALQLLINLFGIVVAAYLVLLALQGRGRGRLRTQSSGRTTGAAASATRATMSSTGVGKGGGVPPKAGQ